MAISRRTKIGGAIGGAVLAAVATTTMLLTGPAVTNIAPGGDLQAAINAAQPGDTLVLQADGAYVCPGGCVLPNKTGTEFITIKSSRYEEIPVRVMSSQVPDTTTAKLMARVSSSFSTEPVFRTAPSAHHYKLLGLDIAVPAGQATRLVEFGVSGAAQDTVEEMPHDLVIDKSWIHGGTTQEVQRCVALNSTNTDITNSWLTDCHGRGYDSQAIAGWNGGGNYKIINNSLSAPGENFMLGGSPASIPNLVPTNVEFRRNYVWKPMSWYVNDPSFAGIKWSVKNLFELKNARNVIIDGNIFENNWTDAQAGRAIVFTPRPSDSGVWAVIEDVQFTNNIVKNTGSGMLILGADEPPAPTDTRLRRLKVANNLFVNVNGGQFGSNGFFATVINKTEDVTIEHNTVFQTGNIIGADYAPNIRFTYRDNISRHNQYGIFGGGIGNTAITNFFPGAVVTGNVIAKEVNSPSNAETLYPAGNFFPADLAAVGFVSLTNADYRLAATSPYKGKGTGGSDPGCDIDKLMAAIGGTGPTPTPFPSVSPTATATVTIAPTPSPTPTLPPSPSPSPTATSTPSITSPDGTKAVTFIDATGGVWTIGPEKQTLRNGVHMGGGFGSIYKWLGGTVYVLGTNNWWYKFTGTAWQSVSQLEPGTQPTTRVVPWPKQPGQQNSLLDQQWAAGRYRLRRVDGNSATFELVVN